MSRQNRLRYGIDETADYIISQHLGLDKICFPELQYAEMGPKDGYKLKYKLKSCKSINYLRYARVRWTRKISIQAKNFHRKFWGFKPLKGGDDSG